jgi:hypothetical protein
MLCGVGLRFNLLRDERLGSVSDKRSPEDRELLVSFQALGGFHHTAAVQRSAIEAFRHRFTLRQTRRTVPIMFSIELCRRASAGALPGDRGG